MTILRLQRSDTLNKMDGSEVWALSDDGWKCFKGTEFTISSTLFFGPLDVICQELQALRNSLDRRGGNYHTAYRYRRLTTDPARPILTRPQLTPEERAEFRYPIVSKVGESMLFVMQWCVTDEMNPFSDRPFAPPPEGKPLPEFAEVVRDQVQWYLDHPKDNHPPETPQHHPPETPQPETPQVPSQEESVQSETPSS